MVQGKYRLIERIFPAGYAGIPGTDGGWKSQKYPPFFIFMGE